MSVSSRDEYRNITELQQKLSQNFDYDLSKKFFEMQPVGGNECLFD